MNVDVEASKQAGKQAAGETRRARFAAAAGKWPSNKRGRTGGRVEDELGWTACSKV